MQLLVQWKRYFPMFELLVPSLHFFGLTFLLVSTANMMIWSWFADEMRGMFDWLIMMYLFVLSGILVVMGSIGFVDQFNLAWMWLGTSFQFVVIFCFAWWKSDERGSVSSALRHFWSLLAWDRLRELVYRQKEGESRDWIWSLFGFLVVFGLLEMFHAFVHFPWEYDTIAYHMPIIVEWIQSGSLWEVFYAVWGGPLGYYPSHHELLLTWFMLPFGSDGLVSLFNFAVVAVLIVVMYKILREMGVKEFLAWMASALVMVMPIFLRQVGTGQVDMLMALGILMAWYYFLRTYKRGDGQLFIPMCLVLALTLGTKYLAIIYLIPLLLVFLIFARNWKQASRWWFLWFLVILGSIGSMWYWRNLILTGNPLFPADVSFGSFTLFEGYKGLTERIQELSLWYRVTESGEWAEWLAAMVKETGWHLYLVLVAYVLLVVEMMSKLLTGTLKRGEGKVYTLMLFFLPTYWYLYFIAPYTASMMEHNVRYAMPWLMLAMIMVVYVVHKLGAARKFFVMALMGVIWWQFLKLLTSTRSGVQPFLEFGYVQDYPGLFVFLLGLLLLGFLLFECWRKRSLWRYPLVLLFLGMSVVFLGQADEVRSEIRAETWQHKYDFSIMKIYEWLDENAPADATVANSLNPLYYPLYGEKLSRKVRYVNINSCTDCDYYGYHQRGMTVRDQADYGAWKKNLELFGADYIVLGYSIKNGLEGVRPYELEWVEEHVDDFEELFRDGEVAVYKLRDEGDNRDNSE